ncbi:MAG: efflux RND transporter periplasmic adaptor subunit [Legionella sp.]|nr:efflux RND transporter periplasmic adaptor subunit [Legionella sp.]
MLIAVAYASYWMLIGRFYESTDDAYVNGNIIPVTTQVAGTINTVRVDDTQRVKENQLLVQLDPIDTQMVLDERRAVLARTIRETQQLFINQGSLRAGVSERETEVQRAKRDFSRRGKAIRMGAVSQEELIHSKETQQTSEAFLIQARSALLSNLSLTTETTLAQHPAVQAAAANLRQAYIDFRRTKIYAPLTGTIAKRTAEIGQRVSLGAPLMAIVPLEQVWVDANFKERQMRLMRIGQPVSLTADVYGSSVVYHGKIQGFSAGTGSAFALLPPQNATGNWIKVVQRLPIRIQLDHEELKAHPLRLGLSMEVTVDLHNTQGSLMGDIEPIPLYQTPIFDTLEKEADAEVAAMMATTIGKIARLHQ